MVILAVSPIMRLNENAVLDLEAAVARVEGEGRKLILCGVSSNQYKVLEQHGLQLVKVVTVKKPTDQTSYQSEIQQLKGANVEIVVHSCPMTLDTLDRALSNRAFFRANSLDQVGSAEGFNFREVACPGEFSVS